MVDSHTQKINPSNLCCTMEVKQTLQCVTAVIQLSYYSRNYVSALVSVQSIFLLLIKNTQVSFFFFFFSANVHIISFNTFSVFFFKILIFTYSVCLSAYRAAHLPFCWASSFFCKIQTIFRI